MAVWGGGLGDAVVLRDVFTDAPAYSGCQARGWLLAHAARRLSAVT